MNAEWWSWVLTSVGIMGLYLMTKKNPAGFVVGLGAQLMWIMYALSTEQYGFVVSAIAYGFVNVLGFYRWTAPVPESKDKTIEH